AQRDSRRLELLLKGTHRRVPHLNPFLSERRQAPRIESVDWHDAATCRTRQSVQCELPHLNVERPEWIIGRHHIGGYSFADENDRFAAAADLTHPNDQFQQCVLNGL